MAQPPSSILSEDLIVQILSWLPVKSLVRFRCVSKFMKSLISDPSFVELHLQRSPKNGNLLLKLKDPGEEDRFVLSCSMFENPSSIIVEDLDLGYQFSSQHIYDIIGSCNGLVCFVDVYSSSEEYQVCLWNPATKFISQKSTCEGPYFGATVFGFGYDCLSDTYKVVAILVELHNENITLETETKVYNIGDNCWKNIQSFPGGPSLIQETGVYLSGTLNWLADQFIIVSFDLGKETYKQLLLPSGLDEHYCAAEPSLGVLKDCLCFCHHYEDTHLVLWQMKEYGVENSWTQLLSINHQNLQFHYLQDYPFILGRFENGGFLINTADERFIAIMCDQRDNEIEYAEISNNILWIYATDYVQSLVSPVGIK